MAVFRCISRKILLNNIKDTKCGSTFTLTNKLSTYEYSHDKDPAPIFFNKDIQALLKSLTRVNLSKVFKKRRLEDKKLELPVYKFMTTEQLQEAMQEAQDKADELLQMPPAVQVIKPETQILQKEPALQGLETSRIVFTDITFGIKDSERLIVVREPDGTLQKAERPLRVRMNQVYFPIRGREIRVPKMFEESILRSVLDRKEYEFVLDRACIQFEADDPEYQRVTSTTYLHINDNNGFDLLRSTRHFGSMTFFLIWFKNIDNLLLELIETAYMEDAVVLVNLYGKVHSVKFTEGENVVEEYIKKYSVKKGPLELAIQAYNDLEKERRELEQGIKVAHGRA